MTTPNTESQASESDPSLRLSQIRERCVMELRGDFPHATLRKEDLRTILAELRMREIEVSDLIRREQALREENESLNRHSTHALHRNKENAERAEANKQAFIKADYERLRAEQRAKAAEDRADALRAYVQHRNCKATWPMVEGHEYPCTCGLAELASR